MGDILQDLSRHFDQRHCAHSPSRFAGVHLSNIFGLCAEIFGRTLTASCTSIPRYKTAGWPWCLTRHRLSSDTHAARTVRDTCKQKRYRQESDTAAVLHRVERHGTDPRTGTQLIRDAWQKCDDNCAQEGPASVYTLARDYSVEVALDMAPLVCT